ncbi:MAG: alanine--tRNA ligase [Candidatus Aenigmatarchaeota archaeon]|nr:MAG: alanine--tRNA ligase [Candidatus Aenigmarchaeota archaeon]
MDKSALIKELQKDWKKYWKVELFEKEGFARRQCEKCKGFFWTLDASRANCGENPCADYSFIGVRRKDWDYYETWKQVERFFIKNGHTSVPRYPVICRWRPDLYFNIASIINFQRRTPKGITFALPHNPLIVPQVCLRFTDLPNIGVTGRHHSAFVMLGQHAIPEGNGYWKDEAIRLDWEVLTNVLGIKPDALTFKEDAWAGGGAFGYSLEYHANGLELGNTVFTEFLETNGVRERLTRPVVDMGAGFDRWVWYLNGTLTSYDSAFGPVLEKMKKGIEYDGDLFARYSRISGALNFEDVLDAKRAKSDIASALRVSVDNLNKGIGPLQAVYTIADHAKALLFALVDGGLPSNVGGGYNLRVLLRRAHGLIEEYGLDYTLLDVMDWHARSLKAMHPELVVDERVRDIIETDLKKFADTKAKVRKRVTALVASKQKITDETLVTLYDSEGVTPELIEAEARKEGIDVTIPADFYARVTEKHMEEKAAGKKRTFSTESLAPTKQLCYTRTLEHDAVVADVQGEWIVLDTTAFYPEGGGQMYDTGTIGGVRVTDVQKDNGIVFHKVADAKALSRGDRVRCKVDEPRRMQLTQHHDATHIINGCARAMFGTHAWQHGALKDVDHARIDVTHYKPLTEKELGELEERANKIVREGRRITKSVHTTEDAEAKYGFGIYQGGVPWGDIRIVNIENHDIEACGGTHSDNTSTVGKIIITGTERVQDGIVRVHFVAGRAAEDYESKCAGVLEELGELLNVRSAEVPDAIEKLAEDLKDARKKAEQAMGHRAKRAAEGMTFVEIRDVHVLVAHVAGDARALQKMSGELSREDTVIFLIGETAEDAPVFASAGELAARDYHVGRILKELFATVGGKGGGTPVLGQGTIKREKIEEAVEWLKERVK